MKQKGYLNIFLCYLLWGFQPLYWTLLDGVDSLTLLGVRILCALLFSLLLLAATHRLDALGALLRDRASMRRLLPAVVFLLADWGVFLVAVQNGHVLDVSLGYYISPLVIFALGVLVYREKCSRIALLSLGIAVVGVLVSAISFGSIPLLSLVLSFNWSVYAAFKKGIRVDGVVSIAAETLLLSLPALCFLLLFRGPELAAIEPSRYIFLIGSGVVTALPMFLYSNCVSRFPLIVMCFAQYLSPSFNLLCGLLTGEKFTPSQLVSLAFFLLAIVVFSVSELQGEKKKQA